MQGTVRRRIRRVSPYPLAAVLLVSSIAAAAPRVLADSTYTAPPVELKLPADIVFSRNGSADSAVTFSHATHVGFADNRCTACHPKPFHMLHPTHRTSHAVMNAGGSCGGCHDGKHAFAVKDSASCGTCHAGRAAHVVAVKDPAGRATPAVAAKFPAAHGYPQGESSPGRVTFRHETHLKRGERCATCHPKPFTMHFSPPRPGGGMHEASACGACHDGKKSFGAEDPAACTRCHVDTGAKP